MQPAHTPGSAVDWSRLAHARAEQEPGEQQFITDPLGSLQLDGSPRTLGTASPAPQVIAVSVSALLPEYNPNGCVCACV